MTQDNKAALHEPPSQEEDATLLRFITELSLYCPRCAYDLRWAASVTCPECGTHLRERDFRFAASKQPLPNSGWLLTCIIGACCLCVGGPIVLVAAGRVLPTMWPSMPCGVSCTLLVASGTLPVVLVWYLAYRPLRALSLPVLVRGAMGVMLGLAALITASAMVWALVLLVRIV